MSEPAVFTWRMVDGKPDLYSIRLDDKEVGELRWLRAPANAALYADAVVTALTRAKSHMGDPTQTVEHQPPAVRTATAQRELLLALLGEARPDGLSVAEMTLMSGLEIADVRLRWVEMHDAGFIVRSERSGVWALTEAGVRALTPAAADGGSDTEGAQP